MQHREHLSLGKAAPVVMSVQEARGRSLPDKKAPGKEQPGDKTMEQLGLQQNTVLLQ